MRKLRVWGLPVLRMWAHGDPIQHLGDPDATPAPVMTGARDADPDGPPVAEPELDVPPETRPWDVATEPTMAPSGRAGASPARTPHETPHCDGRHAGDARCDYCDALTDTITALKRAEKRIADLETAVGALIDDVGRLGREVHQ